MSRVITRLGAKNLACVALTLFPSSILMMRFEPTTFRPWIAFARKDHKFRLLFNIIKRHFIIFFSLQKVFFVFFLYVWFLVFYGKGSFKKLIMLMKPIEGGNVLIRNHWIKFDKYFRWIIRLKEGIEKLRLRTYPFSSKYNTRFLTLSP
jgi:hypothetical protein